MRKSVKIASGLLAVVFAFGALSGCRNVPPPETEPPVGEVVDPSVPEVPTESGKPVISGLSDVTITQGKYFNFLNGVSAVSANGDDLTSRISVGGEVNTSQAGTYTLTYTVTDFNGITATADRTVRVSANPDVGKEQSVPVYTTAEPYNIAKGCLVSATSAISDAEYAVDGDEDTRWESAHGIDDVSLTVDLGASLSFEGLLIHWEAAYAVDYDVLISADGENYELLKSVTQNGDTVNSFELEAEARYVRLHCTKRVTSYGYSIFELQIFGCEGTVVPTDVYPVLYDAQKSGSPDWETEREEWLQFDFGSVQSFDFMRLSWKGYLTPARYDILISSDGVDYVKVKTANLPYSADTYSFYENSAGEKITLSARYVKVAMHALPFYTAAYRIAEAEFRMGDNKLTASVTASSSRDGFEAELAVDGTGDSYWESDNVAEYKTVDLGAVKAVGRVDLYWRGDDGGKGKYYDLLISSDGDNWELIFRQIHGDKQLQSVYVYESARYLRVVDYQNTDPDRFMLEGIVVNSQFPASSGEGKVEYDVSLQFPEYSVVSTANGSYLTGGTDFPTSRLIAYLDDSLRGKPVPSNDWWQGLLVQDKGYNMFMNPLTATFLSDGLWLTNPGEGYFSGLIPGNGSQTVDVDARDIRIGYAGMSADAEVRVTDYSDYGVTAVMTDNRKVDKLTAFLSEGALYAYCLFAEPEKATIWADNLVAVYDLNGKEILSRKGTEFTGDAVVVCVRTHSGYEGGARQTKDENGNVTENGKEYEERYYVVSVPADTRFIRGDGAISVVMTKGNYMSVGAAGFKTTVSAAEAEEAGAHGSFDRAEAALLHEHGYAFVAGTYVSYGFDGATNAVTTEFRLQTQLVRAGWSGEAYTAYMPHHQSKSAYDFSDAYIYPSVRGNCVGYVGNSFTTVDYFYGVVPTFAEPDDDGYSAETLYRDLLSVYANNGGDKSPADSGLISGDPYWQGKNLHPMAMAALAADQIGATDLREAFLDKIEYILTDWFTYDAVADQKTGAYFYYDSEWGTLYYKNSEFGAGVNLADHYFTYGYYILASGVLCAYRPEFAERFGDMIELLIRDYMNWRRDDELFPYMRNFDMFAGHGWAGGYADNNGGNNQESAGEALNSWVGAYLYATAVGNEEIRLAAIYGFTTELNAVKHYWFNYNGDFADCYPYGVAGQVYGASNFYGTFFNGEPLYMYGIHLIPGEEYLTSYALGDGERERLKSMIDTMKREQALWNVEESHKSIYAWQHIFIPIVAIYDADEAIDWYRQVLSEQGNVGNTSEQFNVYYLIHGMKSVGLRSTDIWAENGASATIYQKDGGYTAVCWNPASEPVRYTFRNRGGVVGSAVIPARSLVNVDPTTVTENIRTYCDSQSATVGSYSQSQGVSLTDGGLLFAEGGGVTYRFACGASEEYCRIVLRGSLTNARLLIDGSETALSATENGWQTAPLIITFKHIFEIRASGGTLTAISFEPVALQKLDITGAVASASSANGANTAALAVDGDATTRWESQHGSDEEWLVIELPQEISVYQMRILWEAASAAQYSVSFSLTGEDGDWTQVFTGTFSQGGNRSDTVTPDVVMLTKFVRIEGIRRLTGYGYSIFEIELFGTV